MAPVAETADDRKLRPLYADMPESSMDALRKLLEYHQWATELTLDSVSALDQEAYARDLGTSFASVRGTLIHTFIVDLDWLADLAGDPPERHYDRDAYPTIESLREPWREVHARWLATTDGDWELDQEVTWGGSKGAVWQNTYEEIVRHVVNHGTYHRGQVASMLRQLGVKPRSTDLIFFSRRKVD
jgi:uncharacterized damage-inducible protein DinB